MQASPLLSPALGEASDSDGSARQGESGASYSAFCTRSGSQAGSQPLGVSTCARLFCLRKKGKTPAASAGECYFSNRNNNRNNHLHPIKSRLILLKHTHTQSARRKGLAHQAASH